MQSIILATLAWVLLIQFAFREGLAAPSLALVPEAISGLVVLYVAFRWVATRRLRLPSSYLVILGLLLLGMVTAIVWQGEAAGTIVAGLRHYFKFLPFLLLPAVVEFTPKQLRLHLWVIGAICAIQPPVALYQRFVEFAGDMHSGDLITGTLGSSAAVSMVMIGAVAFLVCAYLRGRIGMLTLMVTGAYCCIPVMINETKVSIVLLPLVLIFALALMPNRRQLFRKLVPVLGAGAVMLVIFVAVYDYIAEFNEFNTPIADFLTEEALRDYLYTGNRSAAAIGYVGRVDSIVLAIENISKDPILALFGLGPGNASPSSIAGFAGEYARYDRLYGVNMTEASRLLWEVGFFGSTLVVLFFGVLLKDAKRLSREPDFVGFFGHAWFVVGIVMFCGLFYIPLLGIDDLSAPLWFYAGVIGAARMRQIEAVASQPARRVSAPPPDSRRTAPPQPLYTRHSIDKPTT